MSTATATAAVVSVMGVVVLAQPAFATREEVLAEVFPAAQIEAERLFLREDEMRRVEELAGSAPPSPLVARYTARRDGQIIGRAYVDTHVVRTKPESLLVVIGTDGEVRHVEATAFLEPPEYFAPTAWMQQFAGKRLDDDLALQRSIRPIAGATLTARSTTAAVRRALAIHQIVADNSDGAQ